MLIKTKIEIALCCIPCLLYNLIAASIMNANSGAAAKCASSTNSSPKKDGKSHKGKKWWYENNNDSN